MIILLCLGLMEFGGVGWLGFWGVGEAFMIRDSIV
jgi:hypothetical protein